MALARWGWIKKGVFAVLDQGLFAGANFVVSILLARWLLPEEYGAFALTYSLFLLVGSVHNAIFIEPMVVFGAGEQSDRFSEYLGTLISGHLLSLVPVSAALFTVVQLLSRGLQDSMESALSGLSMAMPFILLQWLLRRVFYVSTRPELSAAGGALYLVLHATTLWWLKETDRLSPTSAFLSMGTVCLVTVCFFLWKARPRFSHCGLNSLRVIARKHWDYGKWATGSALLSWLPNNLYFAVLGVSGGLEASGELKALTNIFLPMNHIIVALSSLILPALSRLYAKQAWESFKSLTDKALGWFLLGSLANWGLLSLFHREIIRILYGAQYMGATKGLLIGALLPLSYAVTSVLGVALKAQRRAEKVFKAFVVTGIACIVPGVLIATLYGSTGAITAQVLAQTAGAVTMWFIHRRQATRSVAS